MGCKTKDIENYKFIQKIDNFKMNIYSKNGEKIYSIKSPSSSYNQSTSIFNLQKTTIHLFEKEKKKYIINSDVSELSNKNKVIKLIGNVELRTRDLDNDKINADKFIWNFDDKTYTLLGKVVFENDEIILSSNKASLNADNTIEFFNPVKYIIKKNNSEKPNYEINSENAFYNIDTKSVSFKSKDKKVRTNIYF